MSIDFYIKQSDLLGARVGIRNVQNQSRETLQQWLREAVETAAAQMVATAPRDRGLLASAIRVHDIEYRPGGLGGGGAWEARIDIDPFVAPHYSFVFSGTGIYGPTGTPITAKGGGPMVFSKGGEGTIFRTSQTGRKPDRDWWDQGVALANEIISFHAKQDQPFTER